MPHCPFTPNRAQEGDNHGGLFALQPSSVDLVLCVRFLERALLPHIVRALRPGGFCLWQVRRVGPGWGEVQHTATSSPCVPCTPVCCKRRRRCTLWETA